MLSLATRQQRQRYGRLVHQFIDACCEHERNSVTKELYDAYSRWCENSGFDVLPKIDFGKALGRKGYQSVRGRSGAGWKKLNLLPDYPAAAQEALIARLAWNGAEVRTAVEPPSPPSPTFAPHAADAVLASAVLPRLAVSGQAANVL
jgi:phage/plasmid-associated DNA primase